MSHSGSAEFAGTFFFSYLSFLVPDRAPNPVLAIFHTREAIPFSLGK